MFDGFPHILNFGIGRATYEIGTAVKLLNAYSIFAFGNVIPCTWHQNPDTGIYTYQHNMVLQTADSYVCTICGRTCTK